MSKGNETGEKSKEIKVDPAAKKPEGTDAKHHDHKLHHENPKSNKKPQEALPGHCSGWHCKSKSIQFNFCAEHFDQFKFGLIKKTGEPVSDYEKKYEHYMAYKAKQKNRRVA